MTPERLQRERAFHERRSARRRAALSEGELRFEDAEWLDHESWVRDTFALLGDLDGKRVLDFGAGEGLSSVVLARMRAEVFAFDLSHGNALLAARRARANGVGERVHLQEMAGEALGYRDRAFDAGLRERHPASRGHRYGRPGALPGAAPGRGGRLQRALGGNPFLEFVRRSVPYRGKDRTPDERPLREEEMQKLRRWFPSLEVRGYQLLSMIRRQLPWRPLVRFLGAIDRALLRLFPGLGRYCRYAVIVLRKDAAGEGG